VRSHALHLSCFIAAATPEIYTLPYTTLFRSARQDRARAPLSPAHAGRAARARAGCRTHAPGPDHRVAHRAAHGSGRHVAGEPDSDRKSTRLNSSHVAISYAVFCLKKKKKKIQ